MFAQRSVAKQDEVRAKAVRQPAERVDHRLGPLFAIEPAGIDQQRRRIGHAETCPKRGIAPVGSKFAKLDPQRNDFDRIEPEIAQFRRAAIFGQSIDQVEFAVELAAIPIAQPRRRAGQRLADRLGERPLDIDGREIGHIGRD